jgi:hypothetical protein
MSATLKSLTIIGGSRGTALQIDLNSICHFGDGSEKRRGFAGIAFYRLRRKGSQAWRVLGPKRTNK